MLHGSKTFKIKESKTGKQPVRIVNFFVNYRTLSTGERATGKRPVSRETATGSKETDTTQAVPDDTEKTGTDCQFSR